jgi:hypothetical protein
MTVMAAEMTAEMTEEMTVRWEEAEAEDRDGR